MQKTQILSVIGSLLVGSPLMSIDAPSDKMSAEQLGAEVLKPYSIATYYAAPLEDITIIPTKRSLQYEGLHFMNVSSIVRFMIDSFRKDNSKERLQNIQTVVLDYGIKPADTAPPQLPVISKGPVDEDWFAPRRERYFLTMKFFKCPRGQIENPSFQITAFVPATIGIGPIEAFRLMITESFSDLINHPDKNHIVLDMVGE